MTSKNAAAWLDAKLTDKNKRRKKGGQGGTGGEGEIRLIQVRVTRTVLGDEREDVRV